MAGRDVLSDDQLNSVYLNGLAFVQGYAGHGHIVVRVQNDG
jgi:hypothetical protein